MTKAEQEKLENYFRVHIPDLLPSIQQAFDFIEEQERLFNLEYSRNRVSADSHSNRADGAEWVLVNLLRHISRLALR